MSYSIPASPSLAASGWTMRVDRAPDHKDLIISKGDKVNLCLHCKSFWSFLFSRKVFSVKVISADGKSHRLYLNIAEIAKGLSVNDKEANNLKKLVHKEGIFRIAQEYEKIARREESIQEKTADVEKLMSVEDAKQWNLIKDVLPSTINNLYQFTNQIHQKFEKRPRSQPYLVLKKGDEIALGIRVPLSVEYHGKNEKDEPIFFVRYEKNFSKGSFKKASKMLDLTQMRVLVKAKMTDINEYKKELDNMRSAEGISGILPILFTAEYNKADKSVRRAIYTPYQNLGDLQNVLEKQPSLLSKADKLSVLNQVVKILIQFHNKGMVHRDIKIENIFMRKTEDAFRAVVADLGLSSPEFPKDKTQLTVGTPDYVAPELWDYDRTRVNPDRITRAVDVWALGIVCKKLFGIASADVQAIRPGDPDYDVKILISRMLENDPQKRISLPDAERELSRMIPASAHPL